MTEHEMNVIKCRIQLKLSGLNIKATFVRVEEGPVVTTFYYILDFNVPIAKIINKEEDIAISIGVESVLISRKGGEIAIAVPNADRKIVPFDRCLFDLITSP